MSVLIRPAVQADAQRIVEMSHDLSVHEGDAPGTLTVDAVLAHGFGARPLFECLVAEQHEALVGFISTTAGYKFADGAPTVWIAQLFVEPSVRRQGVARRLIANVARAAAANGCQFMQWSVVPTNVEASQFYASIGAMENEITQNYLDRDAIDALAGQ